MTQYNADPWAPQPPSYPTPCRTTEPVGVYTAKAFGWMFVGLLVTFLIAAFGYVTGLIYYVFTVPYLPYVLLVAEVLVVFILSARIDKMSVGAATALFVLYAILNGVVFTTYFLLFDVPSLILVFAVTAAFFGIMALFGYLTKCDLTSLRPLLLGGLIFLLAFGLLSFLLPLENFERIYCLIGIVIFMAFTAYDVQKIRKYHQAFQYNPEMAQKATIISALQLYLDFINIFLYLLRFLNKRK